MRIALIFPGQGSQFVGMGQDFSSKFSAARTVFEKLNKTLDRPLTDTIFSGTDAEISNTVNSQPAIMATSIAIYNVVVEQELINRHFISCVAGHSLGEYSALVANSSITFEDAVRLLDIRSRAMQESMPLGTGGMAALIGKSLEEIEKILPDLNKYGRIFIANDNAEGQVVLSGDIDVINHLCENYKEFKIKRAIKLPVSAPFHCDLISSASKKLETAMESQIFNKFEFPLYSNVTSKKCESEDIKDLLIKQVVSRVKWRESVENMIKDGINCFIEVGPGNILANLVKRINKTMTTISISKIEDLEKLKLTNIK